MVLAILSVLSLMMMTHTHQTIFLYVTIGLCICLVKNPFYILPSFITSSLSTEYFAITQGLSAGRFLSLLILFSFAIYAFKRTGVYKNKYFAPTIGLIVISFFSTSLGYDGTLNSFFLILMNLLTLFYVQQSISFDIEKLQKMIFVSFLIVALFVAYEASTNSMFMFEARYGGSEDDEINSNRLAMMMEQCGAFFFGFFFLYKNIISRILSVSCFLIALFVIVATGSRSAMIAVLVAPLVGLFIIGGSSPKKIIIPLVVLLLIGFYVTEYLGSIDSKVIDRFSIEAITENGGAGREDNIRIIMTEVFPDHFLFGSGLGGANMKALQNSYHFHNVCHNILFDPLSQMGLFVFGCFAAFLFPIFKRIYLITRSNMIILPFVLMFFAAIFNGVGETVFYEKFFWNDIAICLLCYNIYISTNRNTKLSYNAIGQNKSK